MWVDVDEFTLATEAAARAAPGSDEMVDALRTAVSLYAGDLLEDCYDDWVAPHRQRLRDSNVSALRRLTAALGDRGEYAEAVRLGRELVRMEPLEEENHRLLMRLHEAAGDRAAAVRAFHECAAVLGRELGMPPGATTRGSTRQSCAPVTPPLPRTWRPPWPRHDRRAGTGVDGAHATLA